MFCTKTLLEEKRWKVCKGIGELGLKIIEEHNKNRNEPPIQPYMINANLFFARKKLKEDIQAEVEAWDINSVHERYKFLQLILLDDLEKSAKIAPNLLNEDENGNPNMSFSEFKEWPILEAFRDSIYWNEFEQYAKNREEHNI